MAIVIDFTGKEPAKKTPVAKPHERNAPMTLENKPSWETCEHKRTEVSKEQRTVKCKDCGAAVDPIAYILTLYHQYETRIDHRLSEIREFEKRQKEQRERKAKREQRPRQRRIERRAETAERAAYNEYQAKILAVRAERQRQLVERLDREIASLPEDPPSPAESEGA